MRISILLLTLLLSQSLAAQTLSQFSKQSTDTRPIFIELFSSQGCSSCPPAEKWFSKFMSEDELWQDYFPISFHVTYWNYLGWRDPFSKRQYSQRQYDHLNNLNIRQVYTPGFVVNGNEWKGWFNRDFSQVSRSSGQRVGKLKVTVVNKHLTAVFIPKQAKTNMDDYQLKLALVGSGFSTSVLRGENRSKNLKQDFTVLSLQSLNANKNLTFAGKVKLSSPLSEQASKLALVIWVEYKGKPIQAVADWLS